MALPSPNGNPARMTGAVLYTPEGIPIDTPTGESGDTVLGVHIEHLHQRIWNHYFNQRTGVETTLNGATAVNARTLIFTDASSFSVGSKIDIFLGSVHQHIYRTITVIATNTVTIDAGIDIALTDGSEIKEVIFNMAVDGSATPQIYNVRSTIGEKVDIIRLLLQLVDATAADDSKFGGMTALTNGVHLRKNINDGESYQTISIWKANKDMKEDMFNLDYTDKAGPSNHGVNGRWSIFDGTGAVINIDGDNAESVELVIQDNLTDLIDFQMKMQGHIEV